MKLWYIWVDQNTLVVDRLLLAVKDPNVQARIVRESAMRLCWRNESCLWVEPAGYVDVEG